MRYFLIVLTFLIAAQLGHAQQNSLSISATGKVELPADQIQFNININAEADTPQQAYDTHQKREAALVKLLDEYNIKEDDISFEPMSISKRQNYNRDTEEKPVYQTQQTVYVILRDFDAYEKIQIGLIQHEFDNFNGSFASTELEEGQDEALRKAIQEAKRKATLIAETSGVDLGNISNISYNHSQPQHYARETMQMKAASDSGSLLKYNQTVTISASVSLQFVIGNEE